MALVLGLHWFISMTLWFGLLVIVIAFSVLMLSCQSRIPILIVELLVLHLDLDEQHLYTTYVLWMCVWKFYRSFGP